MRRGIIGFIVLCAGLIAWTATHSFSQNPAGGAGAGNCCGTKLAVVDLVRVFNDFKQTKTLNAKMFDIRKQLTDEADKRQQEINALREALDGFAPDSADYHQRSQDLMRKRVDLEVWQRIQLEELGSHHLRWIKRTYQMVTDEVAKVAKARGYDLVVTREEMDEPNTTDTSKLMQATMQQILNRKVVYSTPNIDITDEVLRSLDAEFDRRGGEKSLDPKK